MRLVIFVSLVSFAFCSNLLFTTVSNEVFNEIELPVTGKIPEWLSGTLYRNGFGKFEGNDFKFKHLFDALSLLMKFRFEKGRVYYMGKLMRSEYYNKSLNGIPTYRTLGGISPEMTLKERFETLIHSNHDNFNANLIRLGSHLTVISDILGSIKINENNLDYIGKIEFDDGNWDMISSAHPINKLSYQYNYKADMFPPKYKFYRIDTSKIEREEMVEIEVEKLSYVHSFGMTDNYIIFVVYPFYWDVREIMLSTNILSTMKWVKEDKTVIYVIDKRINRVILRTEMDSFFSFHHVNGWEEGDNIYFDMIVYENSSSIFDFYLDKISNFTGVIGGNFRKFNLSLNTGLIEYEDFMENKIEMPKINDDYKGRRYNYMYGIGGKNEEMILKLNREEGEVNVWYERDNFPGEPIFVGSGFGEEYGVLLSVVLDEIRGESYLLVLDGKTMKEHGIVYMNMSVPMGCHGMFE